MMTVRYLFLVCIFLLLSACSFHNNAGFSKATLSEQISLHLMNQKLTGAVSSITVRDAQTGEMLYQHNGSTRLIPASNMKLVTSLAAFALLGKDHQFTTRIQADGVVKKGILRGNLYLAGTGDPGLTAHDLQVMVKNLVSQGITGIQGDIVIDDSEFDQIRLGTDWAQDDEPMAYAAQISPLTLSPDDSYHAGSIVVNVTGGKQSNEPGFVSVVPNNDYVNIINQSITGTSLSISVTREHGTNNIVVSGSIPAFQTTTALVSVWEPTQLVSHVFMNILKENGIHVKGAVRTGSKAPAGASVLVQHNSANLSELAMPLMKLSNNTIAEILLKTIGRKYHSTGTTETGIAAVIELLKARGMDVLSLGIVDGSGLSRRNLLTTEFVTDLLIRVQNENWFSAWYASLPVACLPEKLTGGGLRNRLCGIATGKVVAKTGGLTGVSALSGYVINRNDKRLAFSMIMNNQLASVRDIQDEILTLLVKMGE